MYSKNNNIIMNRFDELFNQFFNNDFFNNDMFSNRLLGNNNLPKTNSWSDDNGGQWFEKNWESPDGTSKGYSRVYVFNPQQQTEQPNKNNDLQSQLKEAVAKEDYEKAAELKKQIDTQKENKDKINELQSQLKLAVQKEDYLKAAELKKEIDKIK
jgi:hypothetical protein